MSKARTDPFIGDGLDSSSLSSASSSLFLSSSLFFSLSSSSLLLLPLVFGRLVELVRPVRLLGSLGFLRLFRHVKQILVFQSNKVYRKRILFCVPRRSCRRDGCAGQ